MATLIRADGTEQDVRPVVGGFTLDELYNLLGCSTIETLTLHDGRTMVIDEEGKYTDKPRNERATDLGAARRYRAV